MRFFSMIVTGVAGVGLLMIEFFFSTQQKQRYKDRAADLWNQIDEFQKRSLLKLLRRSRKWIFGTALVFEFVYVYWIVTSALQHNGNENAASVIAIGIAIAALGLWLGFKGVQRILRAESLSTAFLLATLFLVVALIPVISIGAVIKPFANSILPTLLTTNNITLGIALGRLVTVFTIVFSFHCTIIILLFWLSLTTALLLVFLLKIMLYATWFVLRAVADHPKALQAEAAILLAIATVLKYFS